MWRYRSHRGDTRVWAWGWKVGLTPVGPQPLLPHLACFAGAAVVPQCGRGNGADGSSKLLESQKLLALNSSWTGGWRGWRRLPWGLQV